MRTDALDLEIGGSRVRVICEEEGAIDPLREALARHVVDDPAPVGFVLQRPGGDSTLHVLVDRSGFVLGRIRSAGDGVALLAHHLSVFLPAPPDTIRLRMRALVDDAGASVLAAFPLFVDPPVIERRLERESHRLVDRVAVDIGPDGALRMSPAPWLAGRQAVGGHAPAPTGPCPVRAVLLPRVGPTDPTHAAMVAFLAGVASPLATCEARVDTAEQLLSAGTVRTVPLGDRAARYDALRR